MNELKIFEYEEKQVRTQLIDGEPWFVAKDVCEILDISDIRQAVERIDQDEKLSGKIYQAGQYREMWIINESGLYSMVLTSNKPEAKKFKKWITSEIIPSIRKTGTYNMPSGKHLLAAAILEAQKVIEEKDRLIEDMKPKVEFFETVCGSKDCIDIGSVAKVLNCGIGRNKLFEFLRNREILDHENKPFQRYIDRGFFRVIEQSWQDPKGETHINLKTMVYQTGVSYIRLLLKKSGLIKTESLVLGV